MQIMSNELQIWSADKQTEIKELFAKNLTNNEFQTFVWIWKATWLNPFLREIWAVKYGDISANIFIWRDWYRKSAQSNKEYDYHSVDAVYENDKFEVKNWEVEHSYNFKDRGKLIWAYCIVKRKSSSKAMFTFVELSEYIQPWKNGKKTVWDSKPATMIKKVAEAQWLRWAFQELFWWTYDESEDWNDKKTEVKKANIPEVSEEEQNKNYNSFYEKMYSINSEEELKNIFLELNKIRKKSPNFINKEQLDDLIKIKDDIKEKLNWIEEIKEAEIDDEWAKMINPEEEK